MIRCRLSMCLLACLLLLATVPAWAGDVRFSGVLPNGALLQQKVESMQERRYRNVVRQHTDYSCGAAALATILRHAYHLQTDEATVIEGMMGFPIQRWWPNAASPARHQALRGIAGHAWPGLPHR